MKGLILGIIIIVLTSALVFIMAFTIQLPLPKGCYDNVSTVNSKDGDIFCDVTLSYPLDEYVYIFIEGDDRLYAVISKGDITTNGGYLKKGTEVRIIIVPINDGRENIMYEQALKFIVPNFDMESIPTYDRGY